MEILHLKHTISPVCAPLLHNAVGNSKQTCARLLSVFIFRCCIFVVRQAASPSFRIAATCCIVCCSIGAKPPAISKSPLTRRSIRRQGSLCSLPMVATANFVLNALHVPLHANTNRSSLSAIDAPNSILAVCLPSIFLVCARR